MGQLHITGAIMQVIPAFEEAMVGMRVGGVRRLIVPQELGYPGQPPDFTKQGPTPGNFSVSKTVLLFDISRLLFLLFVALLPTFRQPVLAHHLHDMWLLLRTSWSLSVVHLVIVQHNSAQPMFTDNSYISCYMRVVV